MCFFALSEEGLLPDVFFGKIVLKVCTKFTGEHPCRSVISIKLLCNFNEITCRCEYTPINLPHIFRKPFSKNTYGGLLLHFENYLFFRLLKMLGADQICQQNKHGVKSVLIRSFSSPYLHALGLNTESDDSLPFQPECRKMRAKKTPKVDAFHAVKVLTVICV